MQFATQPTATVCAAALAVVFVVAAAGKVVRPRAFEAALAGLGVTQPRLRRVASRTVPVLEVGVAVALVCWPRVGAVLACGLLLAFSAPIVVARLAGRSAACACLSPVHGADLAGWGLVRNGAMLLAGGVAVIGSASTPVGLDGGTWLAAVAIALLVVVLEDTLATSAVVNAAERGEKRLAHG